MAYDIKLVPYEVPQWAMGKLNNVPKFRLKLGNMNTPIQRWDLPGVPGNFSVFIKRDDMTGGALSGNKIRKLEFLLAAAIQDGCKHVITCGGIQSNFCRAVAIASRQLGMAAHFVLKTTHTNVSDIGCEGNLLLNRLCGSKMYFVRADASFEGDFKPRMIAIADKIRNSTGEKSFIMPIGGSNKLGSFGYFALFDELLAQGLKENFDDIVFATGSGGTGAGLVLANYLSNSRLRLHGVMVCETAAKFHSFTNDILEAAGVTGVRSENVQDVVDGYIGEGYAKFDQEGLDFVRDVALRTGVILDPVYTGKAAAGMLAEMDTNPTRFKGRRVLFIHTGGIFGTFDGSIDSTLLAGNKKSETNQCYMWPDLNMSPL